jgi:hypothetical protein
MYPYWLFFGIFAFGSVLNSAEPRRRRRLGALWLGLLVIAFMIGLRYRVGVDWENYRIIWNLAAQSTMEQFLEIYGGDPGFYALTWWLRNADAPFWGLNLVCGAVFSWGLVRFASLQANPVLAIAVAIPYLVIVIAMSGTRQATAIGFVFLALVAFTHRNTLAFLGWMATAALFHASSTLLVPLAGLSFAKSRLQAAALVVAMAFVGYFALGSAFGEYGNDYLANAELQSSGTPFRIAMSVLPAALFMLYRHRLPIPPHEWTLWRNMSWLAFASVPLFLIVPSSTAVDRLLLYLFPLQIFMLSWLPVAMARTANERTLVVLGVLTHAAAQMFVFFNFAVNRIGYLPYRNYLFEGAV